MTSLAKLYPSTRLHHFGRKKLAIGVDLELVGIVWPDGDAVDESRMLGAFGGDEWEVRG